MCRLTYRLTSKTKLGHFLDLVGTGEDVTFTRHNTADYLLCRRCGVYFGAVCDTPVGRRAVINTLCLDDRATFIRQATHPDYDQETIEMRLARRARNWMPAHMQDA